jgi:ribosomal protein L11 methyltransferase
VVPRHQVGCLAQLAVAGGASGVQEAPPPGEAPRLQQPWEEEAPKPSVLCTLQTWVPPADAERLQAALGAVAGVPVTQTPAEDADWEEVWKQHHHPVEVGPLRVSPPWQAREGDLVIPPGQAFGTGDHPTTRSCLQALVDLAPQVETCLDVGCGSGVLALAAMRLGLQAQGTDIDPLAVETAIENGRLNELPSPFSTAGLGTLTGPYDLVIANLYAEVLAMLAPELVRLTGTWLVLAGVLWDRKALVLDVLAPLEPVSVVREGDWAHLRLRRP